MWLVFVRYYNIIEISIRVDKRVAALQHWRRVSPPLGALDEPRRWIRSPGRRCTRRFVLYHRLPGGSSCRWQRHRSCFHAGSSRHQSAYLGRRRHKSTGDKDRNLRRWSQAWRLEKLQLGQLERPVELEMGQLRFYIPLAPLHLGRLLTTIKCNALI